MTNPTTPGAVLDGILQRARHLLLDFNGPVCTLYAHQPERLAAEQLRAILAEHAAEIPENVATTADPLKAAARGQADTAEVLLRRGFERTGHDPGPTERNAWLGLLTVRSESSAHRHNLSSGDQNPCSTRMSGRLQRGGLVQQPTGSRGLTMRASRNRECRTRRLRTRPRAEPGLRPR